jgi:hypothetical protein
MYKKIDIYLLNRGRKTFVYECSTNWSKTCKEAKEKFLRKENYLSSEQVKAVFAK